MAELKCVAEKCVYNKNYLCSKGDIMVGGNPLPILYSLNRTFKQKRT